MSNAQRIDVADNKHIVDLRIALEGERRATTQVRAARHHVDALIARAVAAGVPYDHLACAALKLRLGRAPNARERQREADRLRQRRRRAVTGRHGNREGVGLEGESAGVGSKSEVSDMTRLTKRTTTTTTEEFGVEDEGNEKLDCADEAEAANEEEEDTEEDDEEDEEA